MTPARFTELSYLAHILGSDTNGENQLQECLDTIVELQGALDRSHKTFGHESDERAKEAKGRQTFFVALRKIQARDELGPARIAEEALRSVDYHGKPAPVPLDQCEDCHAFQYGFTNRACRVHLF